MIAVSLHILKVALLAPRILVGLWVGIDCLHRYCNYAELLKADSKAYKIAMFGRSGDKQRGVEW